MTEPVWRKSSFSTTVDDEICVELARLSTAVGVRDSKNPGAGHLSLTSRQFSALVVRVKDR